MPELQRLGDVIGRAHRRRPRGRRSCARPCARDRSRARVRPSRCDGRAAGDAAPPRSSRQQRASGDGRQRRRSVAAPRSPSRRRWRSRAATTRARTAADDSRRQPTAEHVRRNGRHVDRQIEPIAQRTGQPAAIALRSAAACSGTRVADRPRSRTDTDSSRRRARSARGRRRSAPRARSSTCPSSSGWRSTSSTPPMKLEHLVEKQHAVVREADLARPRLRSAADERDVRDRVMRRAERTLGDEAAARRQQARRPSAPPSPRAPRRRSAAAGCPAAAAPSSSCRRRADRRAAGCGRRRRRSRARAARSSWPRTSARSGTVDGGAGGRGGGGGRNASTDRSARSTASASDETGSTSSPPTIGGLAGVRRGAAARRRGRRAARRPRSASTPRAGWIEPSSDSSPRTTMSAISRRSTTPCAARMPSAIGQIERGAGLAHVGRREVDRDAVRRKLEAGVADRAPHAVAALAHAGVGQADHREDRHAERDVHLDVDRAGLDAEERRRPQTGEHAGARVQERVSDTAPASVSSDYEASVTDGQAETAARRSRRAATTRSCPAVSWRGRCRSSGGRRRGSACRECRSSVWMRRDGRAEDARDRRERVAALHLVDDLDAVGAGRRDRRHDRVGGQRPRLGDRHRSGRCAPPSAPSPRAAPSASGRRRRARVVFR